MVRKRGTHTWDIYLHYFACPECGYIFEERKDYTYRLGSYIKELECPRCGALFTTKKSGKTPIAPLFGQAPKPEMEWGE